MQYEKNTHKIHKQNLKMNLRTLERAQSDDDEFLPHCWRLEARDADTTDRHRTLSSAACMQSTIDIPDQSRISSVQRLLGRPLLTRPIQRTVKTAHLNVSYFRCLLDLWHRRLWTKRWIADTFPANHMLLVLYLRADYRVNVFWQ